MDEVAEVPKVGVATGTKKGAGIRDSEEIGEADGAERPGEAAGIAEEPPRAGP